jgi:hypothetical protein
MTHLFFHCTGPDEILLDRRGAEVVDLEEAREYALALARYIVESTWGEQDFSQWLIYVSDEEDDEMLTVPFTAALPTLH